MPGCISYWRTEKELISLARERGVRVYGISSYLIHPVSGGLSSTIVAGYANLSEQDIIQGVKLLAESWKIE